MMRLINLIYIGIVFFIFQHDLQAQNYRVEDIPSALKSRANAIVRMESISFDMKNESNIVENTTRAITILGPSGEDYADLTFYYNKSNSIKDIKGVIYDEHGKQIGKFGIKDFRDFSASDDISMYDDYRVKHYQPNINNYPFTIVYSYEKKHLQNLFIPYWRPNGNSDLAVEKSTYQISCKNDVNLRTQTYNYNQEPEIKNDAQTKTYTWKTENIKAVKPEILTPVLQKDKIIVKVMPESFQFFKKRGTVNTWEELGKWVYDELLKDKHDLSKETIAKAKQLTADLSTPREKVQKLYEYLQNKTRYISIQVGIGGLEPFPASYVDKLGYGDCKALVNYLQALLAAVDIPSYYCIVEAGNKKESLDERFANVVDGNHIILCVPMEQDSIWLECTNNKSPFNYLGDFTDDRLVLACTPEGGKILRTRVYPTHENLQVRKSSLKVDEEGTLAGKVTTVFSGTQYDNHFALIHKNKTEQLRDIKKYYNIDNITFQSITYSTTVEKTPVLTEELDVNIRKNFVVNGNNITIQPNVFNYQRPIPESKDRKNELYINRGYIDIDEIEYSFDAKVDLNLKPLDKSLSCTAGNYSLKVFRDKDKIKMIRKIEIKDGTYPAEEYQNYYNFLSEVSSIDRMKYTLPILKQ